MQGKRKPEGDNPDIADVKGDADMDTGADLSTQLSKRLKREEAKLAELSQVVKAAGGDPSVGSMSTGIPAMGGGNFETSAVSLPIGNAMNVSTDWAGANLPTNLYPGPGGADQFTDQGEDGELSNVHSPYTAQALSPKQMMDADPVFYGVPGLSAMDSKDRENFWLREKDFLICDRNLSKGGTIGATHANAYVSIAVWNLCMLHYCSRVARGEIGNDLFPTVDAIRERFSIKGWVLNTLEHLTSVENHANQTVGIVVAGHSPQVPNYWMASPHGRNCPGIALGFAAMKCDMSVPWELVKCTPARHAEALCEGMGDFLPRRVAPEDMNVLGRYELTNDEEMSSLGVRLKLPVKDASLPRQLLAWQLVPICVRDSRYMTDDLATTPYAHGAVFRVGMRGSEDAPTGSLKAVSLEMIMSILAPPDATSMMLSLKRSASLLNKTSVHIGHGYSVDFRAQLHDEKEIAQMENDGINKIIAVLRKLGFAFQHKVKKVPAAEAVRAAVSGLAHGQGASSAASAAAGAAAASAVGKVQDSGGGAAVSVVSLGDGGTVAIGRVEAPPARAPISVAGVPITGQLPTQGVGSAHMTGTGKQGRKKGRGHKGRKPQTTPDSPTRMSDVDAPAEEEPAPVASAPASVVGSDADAYEVV